MPTSTKTMAAKTLSVLSVLVLTCALSNAASGDAVGTTTTVEEKLDRILANQESTNSIFKRVFVSSIPFSANLGGLSGGDIKCQVLAEQAGLDGNHKAWLSSLDEDARDRLTHATVPYALVDGTVIAKDWDDLIDESLAAPIDLDEYGQFVGSSYVMTGTYPYGTLSTYTAGDTCDGWTTSSAQLGVGGVTSSTGWSWSSGYGYDCASQSLHLYCFQQ